MTLTALTVLPDRSVQVVSFTETTGNAGTGGSDCQDRHGEPDGRCRDPRSLAHRRRESSPAKHLQPAVIGSTKAGVTSRPGHQPRWVRIWCSIRRERSTPHLRRRPTGFMGPGLVSVRAGAPPCARQSRRAEQHRHGADRKVRSELSTHCGHRARTKMANETHMLPKLSTVVRERYHLGGTGADTLDGGWGNDTITGKTVLKRSSVALATTQEMVGTVQIPSSVDGMVTTLRAVWCRHFQSTCCHPFARVCSTPSFFNPGTKSI